MAEKKTVVEQPTEADERALLEYLSDKKEDVQIGDRTYRLGPLRKGTRLFVTNLLLKEADPEWGDTKKQMFEDKMQSKIAAAYLLNSWWSLFFLFGVVWHFYWRWLYYVKQYTDSDYSALMLLCKKKAEKQTRAFMQNTTLTTVTKMTTMMMTRDEVKRTQVAHSGEQHGAAQ
ncbi:MAG: hypothetical protein MJZ30_06170 [Paludibacteraceae bacterium]|nr:hypothetical protein [Paludibacteraceae bacterium]